MSQVTLHLEQIPPVACVNAKLPTYTPPWRLVFLLGLIHSRFCCFRASFRILMPYSIAPQSVSVLSCKGEFRFRVGFLRFCHLVHSLKLKEISFDELALQWLCNFPRSPLSLNPTHSLSHSLTLTLTHAHVVFFSSSTHSMSRSHALPYSFTHALPRSSTHSPQFTLVEVEFYCLWFSRLQLSSSPCSSPYSNKLCLHWQL